MSFTSPEYSAYSKQLVAVNASSVRETRINEGGRVLLPQSVLTDLSRVHVAYPLQFKILSINRKYVFASVLEFTSTEGTVVLPDWMYDHLQLKPRTTVRLTSCTLPEGSLIKLQPHKKDFVSLTDPRLVLEQHLSSYPVLFAGSTIVIRYAGREFLLDVTEILDKQNKPVEAIVTIRAQAATVELKVEFQRPLDMPPSPTNEDLGGPSAPQGGNVIGSSGGVQFKPFEYKPPTLSDPKDGETKATETPKATAPTEEGFHAFSGTGKSLGGSGSASSTPAGAVPLTAEQQRELREKRLKALAGKK